jgi:DNA primase
MSDVRPNFRLIKERVSMLDVLARYQVELRAKNHYKREGKCPLPQHSSTEDRATFHVERKENGTWVWACHSSSCVASRNSAKKGGGGLKKGGDLIEFVQYMESLPSLRAAGECLESWYGPFGDVPAPAATPLGPRKTTPSQVNPPLGFSLQGVQHVHPYLTRRGFEEEECEFLGVGFFPGKGSMSGRIVFPIHNASGELVAYAGRLTDDALICEAVPRWKFPGGFSRGEVLYNLHRVIEDDWTEVIVVESFWGVMACIRAGIMNSVALMSNEATDAQVKLLAGFQRVVVCLDGDKYGRAGGQRLIEKLVEAEVESVELKMLATDVQPDDLKPDTLRVCLGVPPVPDVPLEIVEFPQAVGA